MFDNTKSGLATPFILSQKCVAARILVFCARMVRSDAPYKGYKGDRHQGGMIPGFGIIWCKIRGSPPVVAPESVNDASRTVKAII
ncbi:MAG TPA: hypothetical protein DCQ51_11310 [Planktothrix sp. UBA8407]|nr:hypothetical protein [Planktothrix sp. UBA8407]